MTHQLVEAIDSDRFRELVRDVFGTGTRLVDSRMLGAGSGNLAYLVTVSNGERQLSYVFCFNRGLRDDVYEREAEHYRMRVAACERAVRADIGVRTNSLSPPLRQAANDHVQQVFGSTTRCRRLLTRAKTWPRRGAT